ncbi:MAG TPA: carotenoid oxygenase family protein [Bryobacteraceae bacterium]|jgi:all-trans-8'-apo-beta-carotenal 15,15'-oxygenase|nr:carotenoid oxygenase family protein [Bryobacteraceae bacterium]
MNHICLDRRKLLSRLSAMTAAGFVEGALAAPVLAGSRELGYLAVQAPAAEGVWGDLKIEGAIPKELNGNLYRVAPGKKSTFGVPLRHFFDGDAFVTMYRLRDGKATVRGRFIATPERCAELIQSRMLFNEFGTLAPSPGQGGKNQPSINIIHWDGHLLALSEGGHPSALDPETLVFERHWDFHSTLPADVTFTAHPKIDPETGVGYAYGTHKGHDLALIVYRMELDGRLTQIASITQPSYFMIHDMLLGREHIAFVVPPVHYDLPSLFSGSVAPADAIRYLANEPTRLIVLRKDGTTAPLILEQPACMVFHHGNLAEANGVITTDSLLTPDDSILHYISEFSTAHPIKPQPNQLTRVTIDVAGSRIAKREILGEAQEYPRFDTRRNGRNIRYLYTLGNEETFAMRTLFRHDFATGQINRMDAEPGHALEEAIFVPRPGKSMEEEGWLLHQGYSAPRDESYLAAMLRRSNEQLVSGLVGIYPWACTATFILRVSPTGKPAILRSSEVIVLCLRHRFEFSASRITPYSGKVSRRSSAPNRTCCWWRRLSRPRKPLKNSGPIVPMSH